MNTWLRYSIIGIFSAITFLIISCGQSQPTLTIYAWSNAIQPELIERFEKEHSCRVILDTYDSNEAMYAKIKAGATGYDLLFPSNYMVEILLHQKMLRPIDEQRLSNLKYLDESVLQFLGQNILDYAIPFTMTYTGIGYRKDKVNNPMATWDMFGRPSYKGRMTMLNDMREVLGAALLYLGYSINTVDSYQIDEAVQQVLRWKINLSKFESEQYKNGLASAEYLIVQGYNGDVLQIIKENPQVAFMIPEEGTIVSYDCMVIPKEATQIDLAHAFINFLYEPQVSAQNMISHQFIAPNTAAYLLLPEEMRTNPSLFPPREIRNHSEVIHDVGPAIEYYNHAWDRIKQE